MIKMEYDFRGMTPGVANKGWQCVNKYIAEETIARTVYGNLHNPIGKTFAAKIQ